MALMTYILKRAKGNPVYRRKVPADLVGKNGLKSWIVKSLGADPKLHKRRNAEIAAEVDAMFSAMRAGNWRTDTDKKLDRHVAAWFDSEVGPGDRYGIAPPFADIAELTQSVAAWAEAQSYQFDPDTWTALIRRASRRYQRHEAQQDEVANAEMSVADLWTRIQATGLPTPSQTPLQPPPAVALVPQVDPYADLVEGARQPWTHHTDAFLLTKGKISASSLATYTRTFRQFEERVGAKPIAEVTSRDVEKMYQWLKGQNLAYWSIYRQCSNLRQFFEWAEQRHLIRVSPATKLHVENLDPEDDDAKRRPFTTDELNRIFALPLFTGCRNESDIWTPGNYRVRDGRHWLPLVALHTGLRLSEMTQLEVSDIIQVNERPHFSINRESQHGHRKSLKTKSSVRQVPVHPTLIALGFLAWVDQRRKASDDGRLFEARDYGDFVNTELLLNAAKVRIEGDLQTCHAFRHCAEDAFRNATESDEARKRLMGRHREGTGAKYGGRDLTPKESAVIDSMVYPGLDLSRL